VLALHKSVIFYPFFLVFYFYTLGLYRNPFSPILLPKLLPLGGKILLKQGSGIKSFGGVFFEKGFQKCVKFVAIIGYGLGLVEEYILAQIDDVFALKGMGECGDDIHDAAEPPDVGFVVIFLVFDDFRGQV